jgi:MFS family permease
LPAYFAGLSGGCVTTTFPAETMPGVDQRFRRARVAAAGAYLVQGLCFATLLTRVPTLQDKFGFSDGELSLILLAVPVVAGVGSVLAGVLAARWGSALVLRVAAPGVCLAIVAAGAASSRPLLFAAVAAFGLVIGAVDATMNMQGVAVQRRYGRSILMSFHGVWSVAGIAGSLVTAGAEKIHMPLPASMIVVAAVGLAVSLSVGPVLLRRDEEIAAGLLPGLSWAPADGERPEPLPAEPVLPPELVLPAESARHTGLVLPVESMRAGGLVSPAESAGATGLVSPAEPARPAGSVSPAEPAPHAVEPADAKPAAPVLPNVPWRPIILVGIAVMLTYVAESATSNWSAVYLNKGLHGSKSVAALGLGGYLTCQVLGRIFADRVVGRIGPVRTMAIGGVIGALGMAVVVAAQSPAIGIAGFAVVGVGLCVVVPQSFSAAGAVDPTGSGVAIARVNLFNYVGFVVGAALIGAVAEGANLRLAFAIPAVLALGVALLAPAFRIASSNRPAT